MDFELNDDQTALRSLMQEFVRRSIAPVAREWEQSGRYPTEIVAEMRRLGLFGLLVPEEYGGISVDAVSYAIVFEELSRGWMGIAGILGSHSLSTLLISRFGSEEQKRRWLPGLAEGARRSGIALTEPGAGSDLQAITTVARRDGDHYLVRGAKVWITNARHADPLAVLVKTDPNAAPRHAGMSVLMIEAGTPGFTVGRDMGKMGYRGTESCEVTFDDARIPAANLLGVEGQGLKQMLSVLEFGRINIAARSVGIAQAAYEKSLEYSKQRRAFGKAIGEFQAIQLKLADMATDVQAGRLLTWWAATQADTGRRADVETAMAKLFCSEVAIRTSLTALRIHGGYGYSTEFEVERLYRDAPLMAIGEGTNDILRTVIARSLQRDA
jgi:alkylation response protein AidB-like acyl-CoA dehydrogenase